MGGCIEPSVTKTNDVFKQKLGSAWCSQNYGCAWLDGL